MRLGADSAEDAVVPSQGTHLRRIPPHTTQMERFNIASLGDWAKVLMLPAIAIKGGRKGTKGDWGLEKTFRNACSW